MITKLTPSALSLIFRSLVLLSATSNAQSILDPAKIPSCALQCPVLIQAQQACVPPYAPPSNQQTYNSCFCASSSLPNLKAGQTYGTCDGICSAAEMQTVLAWFQGTVCTSAAAPAGNANPQGTTTTPQAQATATSSSSSASGQKASSSKNPSWISQHYQWIIMVIVLVLAAALAVWLGLWLKRRHRRRHLNDPTHRSSVLVANEAAASLRNKHPIAPSSMSQLPTFDSSASLRSGPMSPSSMSSRNLPRRHPSSSGGWTPVTTGVGVGAGAAAAAGAAAFTRGPQRTVSSSSDVRPPHRTMSSGSDTRGGPNRTMSLSNDTRGPPRRTVSSSSDVTADLKGKYRANSASTAESILDRPEERPKSPPVVGSPDQVAVLPRRPSSRLQKKSSKRSTKSGPQRTPSNPRPESRKDTL